MFREPIQSLYEDYYTKRPQLAKYKICMEYFSTREGVARIPDTLYLFMY